MRKAGSLASDGLSSLIGDPAAEPGVQSGVHVGHAAATEQFADLVAAGEQADLLRHLRSVTLVRSRQDPCQCRRASAWSVYRPTAEDAGSVS